jgi:PPOX class probable F420-dependent enzyme
MSEADTAAIEFLKQHRLGVLATGRRDGSPQQSLIGYQFDGKDFVISARAGSAKAKNLRRHSGVSLSVVDGGSVVVVYGRAQVVRDPEEVLAINVARLQRQTPVDQEALARRLREEDRVVIVVAPEKYLPSRL